ncbi:MAG: permease [Candidatus Margulisiibacteriota bacterium]|jgi:uncharacterized membrane protein YraQ (UPF0718 family)
MIILVVATLLCLLLSLAVDRQKTYDGCQRGLKMFLTLLPTLLLIIALISIFLYLTPGEALSAILGARSGFLGVIIAALLGSIALIPGFIAFPLARIFLSLGVPVITVAVFITTLMMVGILTLPLEIKFFGRKAAFMRNGLSFIGAFAIGLLMGLFL